MYSYFGSGLASGWIETDMTAPVRGEELKEMGDAIVARTMA